MQVYTIWEAVFNAQDYYYYFSVRPIAQRWLLLPFDAVAAVLLVVASSLLIHASTDRHASSARPPFLRCLWLLSLGASLQFCSFLLGLIDSCVTSEGDWWSPVRRATEPATLHRASLAVLLSLRPVAEGFWFAPSSDRAAVSASEDSEPSHARR